MKTTTIKLRSIFTSGINLGNQVHRTKKGKGSYQRKKTVTAKFMANYYSSARTNYFRVKDNDAFNKWIDGSNITRAEY